MTEHSPTILFVDDEKPILDGLRRKLSDQDNRWRLLFATGGPAALDVMASEAVDVIVTDMRMPGMDGAALLEEVRHRHPATARFILSGYSQREAIFRTLGPAHQYFVKPCDTTTLVQALERTLLIRRKLGAPELLSVISGAKSVPAFPTALTELFDQLQSANGSAAEVARIISSDVGLTVQLLKFVNSAYFVTPTKVSDVLQAVRLLGFDLVRTLAVVAGVFDAFRVEGSGLEAIRRLGARSLMIGAVARRIAELEGMAQAEADQCQCAGLLSQVGSLILFSNRPGEMARLCRDLDSSGGEIVSAERAMFGASHQEIGGALLSLWGFSDTLVEAVLYHHRPSAGESAFSQRLGPVAVVHAAQHMVKPEPESAVEKEMWKAGLDLTYLADIGVAARIDAWAAEAAKIKDKCET